MLYGGNAAAERSRSYGRIALGDTYDGNAEDRGHSRAGAANGRYRPHTGPSRTVGRSCVWRERNSLGSLHSLKRGASRERNPVQVALDRLLRVSINVRSRARRYIAGIDNFDTGNC